MSNELTPRKPQTIIESVTVSPGPLALPCMGDAANVVDVLRNHFGRDGGRMHTAVEVGVHRGATSANILAAFPNLMLWMVDSYAPHKPDSDYRKTGDSLAKLTRAEQHKHCLAAYDATAFASQRRMFCRFPSVEASKIISTPRLSWVFLDDDHSYSGVRDGIAAWWPKVEAGGLLCGHDYNHPRDGKQFGVKQAVDEFASSLKLRVEVTGTVWSIAKP